MSATGTATARFNENRQWIVTLATVTAASESYSFDSKGTESSSFVLSGTLGGATMQWQGSNDGAVTWANVGTVLSSVPIGGTLTPGQTGYSTYRLQVLAGSGATSINASIVFNS